MKQELSQISLRIETKLREITHATLNEMIVGDTLASSFDNPNLGRKDCF